MVNRNTDLESLPVVVIGAGPVGLAAAAHLAERRLPFAILEAGGECGAAVREWGHVRVFSPWRYNIDSAARRLLEASGWQSPGLEGLPTGHEIVDRYLAPLAAHESIGPHLRLRSGVTSVGRKGFDKVRTSGRSARPFEIGLESGDTLEARAVIDASGTWRSPNPMGAGGNAVRGEAELSDRIAYGIPDVLGSARSRYAGKRVLVVGGGHSAMNVVLDLVELQRTDGATEISWAMRRESVPTRFGGGAADALPARGRLGARARAAVETKRLRLLAPLAVRAVARRAHALEVAGSLGEDTFSLAVDEIVVATGFRPRLEMLREIRLRLDPWLEATESLAPLVDPNLHSCGTVRPHGARELAHPEEDFFVVGMKSYGRAPTFLMTTGYEQARSVVAWLAGDIDAAARVELELPQTGVCNGPAVAAANAGECCGPQSVAREDAAGCCGGSAPPEVDACCLADAAAKAEGTAGCGCGSSASQALNRTRSAAGR